MLSARHTDGGGLSRRQFVRETALAYWTAAGAAGSGMLILPSPGMGQEGSGPVDCGPPPRGQAAEPHRGRVVPAAPTPRHPPEAYGEETAPRPPFLDRQDGPRPDPLRPTGRRARAVPRLDDRSGRPRQLALLDQPEAGHPLRQGRGRLRAFLLRPARTTRLALRRAQFVRHRRERPRFAGPLHPGRGDDHRRRLLRLERLRRVVPSRDAGDLSGPPLA